MKPLLDRETDSHSLTPLAHRRYPVVTFFLHTTMAVFTGLLIVLALAASTVLLLGDLAPQMVFGLPHAPASAAPLLLIGIASLGFQIITHPRLLERFKAFLVSSAFILWGIDQILPPGWLTTAIGDVVIVLYVIDLGWMMGSALCHPPTRRQA